MKKLLINGAGRGNLGLMKAAKEMGVYTIVTGLEGPCKELADKTYPEVHPGHPDEVLEVAQQEKIDGAAITCNDMGLESVGRCNDVLQLQGIKEKDAKCAVNKLYMKEKLVANGVRTARFMNIHSEAELSDAVKILEFPVIVKATDLQGSRGICIVREEDKLKSAYEEVMSLTHKDFCIVEEFIEGTEFGAQAFVYKGEVLFVLPHGDETVMCKTAVPVGHYMPYAMTDALAADVQLQARKAIAALGLDNCAVNIDFISRDDQAYIIELTGRGGANGLTDITGEYLGINYYKMMVVAALGGDPREVFSKKLSTPRASVSKMLTFDRSGIAKSVSVPTLPDTEITMFIQAGDDVRAFTNSNDDIGQVVVSGVDLDECNRKIEKAMAALKIEL
ncbi:MAG: ATP-grasp domain-containing protein [Bacteroidaceae bacterium]|nr:ATP-grasp domain-containing protein [Bacteroidaceae bacterium]